MRSLANRSAVIGLASIVAACSLEAPPPSYFDAQGTVYVSPEFSAAESETLLAAMQSWQTATSGEVAFQARVGGGHPLIRPALQADRINGEFIPSAEPEIVIDTSKLSDTRALRNLALHELGHALGLEHIEHSESVMFPFATTVQELDTWTLAAWHARHKSER